MPDIFYVSLAETVDRLWPSRLLPPPPADVLEQVWFEPLRITLTPTASVSTAVLLREKVVMPLPALPFVSLVLGEAGGETVFLLAVDLAPTVVGRLTVPLALRLGGGVLRAVRPVPADDGSPTTYEVDPDVDFVEAALGSVALSIDAAGTLTFTADVALSLPLCMVGETGLLVRASGVRLLGSLNEPVVTLDGAEVILPPDLLGSEAAGLLPRLQLADAQIGPDGFSGHVAAVWDLVYDEAGRELRYQGTGSGTGAGTETRAELVGLNGGLRQIALVFENNRLTGADITGALVVPYFDEPIDIRLNLLADGDFTVTLLSSDADGITLRKEDLLALTVKSLTVTTQGGFVEVSGGLEPLLMGSDGLQWPRLDVVGLQIDSRGRFRIEEAWLDLKELATLDLFGFHFELSRIGLGYQEPDDKLWIDLSGSLRLIEQIPMGLGVEGFRLTWPRTLLKDLGVAGPPTLDQALAIASRLEVKFDGIYLFYGVPDAVEFEGLIRFIKEAQKVGFAGDVALRIPATGFAAEAGLMVGMNLADPSPYPFLYVYLGVELPAGIPLGQSGLALKGALGLFGLNVAPARTPEQNWYYDWYKRGPIVGAHPTDKWRDHRDALAVGLGVTITTVDGYIKGVRGLIVLALPGPVLVIEGRALILDGLLPAEPPLRALAIFDGQAQTVQFNLEAEAELVEGVLEAYGMVEAFFDFRDVTNWHLYLGQDAPRERRIRADVLKLGDAFLFKAEGYLMLDMVGEHTPRSRLGALIGFRPSIPPVGPVHVTFDAVIDGTAEVTVLPEQAHGRLGLEAMAELSAFGCGLAIAVDAELGADGPRPLQVDAELHVRAELPLPLAPVEEFVPDFAQDAVPDIPPLDVDVTLQFSWTAPEPPEITPPLVDVVAESPFAEGGGALALHERAAVSVAAAWRAAAEASPVVPLDVRPILAFGPQMNDAARDPETQPVTSQFVRHPDGLDKDFVVGLMRFVPSVTAVRLYEHPRNQPWPARLEDWTLVASSRAAEGGRLPGVWLAEGDPRDPRTPPTRRLQLWTTNPVMHTTDALGPGYMRMLGGVSKGTSAAGQILEAHPTLHVCRDVKAQPTCVVFEDPVPTPAKSSEPWSYFGLRFTHVGRATFEVPAALALDGALHRITFPQTVREVTLRFARPPARSFAIRTARRPRTPAELDEVREDAPKSGGTPDYTACRYQVPHEALERPGVWTVRSAEGFDCLTFERPPAFAIAEICYVTVEEAARAERALAQCETNGDAEAPPVVLEPGRYYRLEVETRVSGALRTDALPGEGTPFADVIVDLYRSILGTLGFADSDRVDTRVAFFQTEGPPTRLRPYLKWTSPGHEAVRVFRDDDLLVRFVRPNVRLMFGLRVQALEIVVRGPDGSLIRGYEPVWTKAASGTELLEEELWRQHRAAIGAAAEPVQRDDVLEAQRRGAELSPKTRYEALVIGGAGGARLFRDDFAGGLRPEVWGPDLAGWTVRDGVLAHEGGGDGVLVTGDAAWTDVDVVVDVRPGEAEAVGLMGRVVADEAPGAGGRGWRVAMRPGTGTVLLQAVRHSPGSAGGVAATDLEAREYDNPAGDRLRLRTSVIANRLRIWAFDLLLFDGLLYELARDWTPAARPAGTLLWFPAPALDDEHAHAVARRDLVPSTRGRVGVHATGPAEFRYVEVRDAVLHRVRFTTSAYRGFRELVESTRVGAHPMSATAPDVTVLSATVITGQALAVARRDWYEAEMQFGREELDRPGLEAERLALREAQAAHDAAFRTLAEPLADGLYYAPLPADPVVHLLQDAAGRMFGAWIASPESLDLRQEGRDAAGRPARVGRTTLTLDQFRAGAWRSRAVPFAHDVDSTRVLVLLRPGETWPAGPLRLTLVYHRNYLDETVTADHRYDRPVEKRGGSDATESASIVLG
jgi:hypothetical protein